MLKNKFNYSQTQHPLSIREENTNSNHETLSLLPYYPAAQFPQR